MAVRPRQHLEDLSACHILTGAHDRLVRGQGVREVLPAWVRGVGCAGQIAADRHTWEGSRNVATQAHVVVDSTARQVGELDAGLAADGHTQRVSDDRNVRGIRGHARQDDPFDARFAKRAADRVPRVNGDTRLDLGLVCAWTDQRHDLDPKASCAAGDLARQIARAEDNHAPRVQ